jgi:hypothetical protein
MAVGGMDIHAASSAAELQLKRRQKTGRATMLAPWWGSPHFVIYIYIHKIKRLISTTPKWPRVHSSVDLTKRTGKSPF